ncbi:MAG: pantetheine-phosphate adenylyltransferase [Bacteroidota bacterium]|jgi:pantetheine-phosphate adenylyltransferase|nr:pantetheine-phosphate adenylyltransferase [Bacteroidota bacterium]
MKIAVYPGSFDPITFGHLDVLERAAAMFDRVIITVARNSSKQPLFTTDERVALIAEAVTTMPAVEVDTFDGLIVDYARARHATALLRGLRAVSDFEYEFQMALMNRKLAGEIATVFLMPHEKFTYLNSSIVRELARHRTDVSDFVPDPVRRALEQRFGTPQRAVR